MGKPNTQQVSRAGEHFVAAELHLRGAYAVPFAGTMPESTSWQRTPNRPAPLQSKSRR
jgi:hypothetical protein